MARRNVALSANGGSASAESTLSGSYPASGAINGNRTTSDWGSGGGWSDALVSLPQWWQVDFSGAMDIDEVDVITYGSASAPVESVTTDNISTYGATGYTIQYWDGSAWQTLTTVTGNAYVWRQFTYTPFTTTKIRINVTASSDGTARLVEVEAWGDDSTLQTITGGTIASGATVFAPGVAGTSISVSQAPLEVVWQESTAISAVVSQAPLDVVWQETTPISAVVSQAPIEVVWLDAPVQSLTGATLSSTASLFAPTVSSAISLPTVTSSASVFPPTLSYIQYVVLGTIASGSVATVPAEAAEVVTGLLSTGVVLWPPTVYLDAHARLTAEQRSLLGPSTDTAIAQTTAIARSVMGLPAVPVAARMTAIRRHVLGPPLEVIFTNDSLVGLTWIEVTARSGAFYVWSDRPLPDPAHYYGGWKEPRVIEWGTIRRAASNWTGEYETANFEVTLDDTDRLLRQLCMTQELAKASVVVRMISDGGRRALQVPRIVFRGVVVELGPTSILTYKMIMKDTFADKFSYGAPHPDRIPLRTVTLDDFPNCGQTEIASGGMGYTTTAAYGAVTIALGTPALLTLPRHHLKDQAAVEILSTGALPTGITAGTTYYVLHPTDNTFNLSATPGGPTIDASGSQSGTHTLYATYGLGGIGQNTIAVENGSGIFEKGQSFRFGSLPTAFTVESSSGTDPETTLQFTPSLPGPVPDGDAILVQATHQVEPALGTPVPIVYGLISDQWFTTAAAPGSGALPFDPTLAAPYAFAVNIADGLGSLAPNTSFAVTAVRDGKEGPRSNPSGTTVTGTDSTTVNWTAVPGAQSYRVYIYDGTGFPPPGYGFNPNTGLVDPVITTIRIQTHDATTHDGLPGLTWGNTQEADFQLLWHAWTDGTTYNQPDFPILASDEGDGQGPVKYVGDRVLPDGHTYAEFLWAGHACYAPDNRPILQLYFWNRAVDRLAQAPSGLWHDGVATIVGDLATEAGTGGRICLPGYDNWSDNGFTTPYVDYHGRRYTVFFLRGIFRDWALGIAPAPDNLGGTPLAVNAYGCDTNADGSGALITNGLQQYLHIIQNWCTPVGNGYQSGAWLPSPRFRDDPGMSMFDEASFAAADAQSQVYVTGGFRGDFIIGANNEVITRRDTIARLNFSFGVDSVFNRKCQFMVNLMNIDPDTNVYKATLDYVRDIYTGTFEIESRVRELWNVIQYRHTQDYMGRTAGGWRSLATGSVEVTDNPSISIYERLMAPNAFFYMLRGKNANTAEFHVAAYQRGTDTAMFVLALKLLRAAHVPHYIGFQTGAGGFMYEVFDIAPITHYEGLSSTGWTDHATRIDRMEIFPTDFSTRIEAFDMAHVFGET